MPKQKYTDLEEIKKIYDSVKKIGYKKTSEKFNEHISLLERIVRRYEANKEAREMKVIIIAAGPSTRLRPLTEYKPKCLLEIEGKSILERTMDAFLQNGIDDFAIVRGYQKDKIDLPNIDYYDNDDYYDNNILESLFYAEEAMKDGFIFTYSDILYSSNVVRKLLDSPYDFSFIVDTDWRKRYEGRTKHPTDEAELAIVEDGKIIHLSKFFNPDAAHGEFIGLGKFSKKGAEILMRNYNRAKYNKTCKFEGRFHDATTIQKAYLTDMLEELIFRGYSMYSVDIKGEWVEMDTDEDYEYAQQLIKDGKI
ncbi:MAG: NTP transferase domain-containing protein [Candidatus Hermodarchaeota archaeon]